MLDVLDSINVSDWRQAHPLEYVSHPVNAFHLMKRTTVVWPALAEQCTSPSLEAAFEEDLNLLPNYDDFRYGACVGLLNIELYYSQSGMTFLELTEGRVRDPATGTVYQANHQLTSDDCLLIADAAKRVWRFDK